MTTADKPLEFGTVASELREQALALLWANLRETERATRIASTLDAANRGEITLDSLFAARRGGDLVGVIWGQLLPGKVALLWPARLAAGEATAVADELQSRIDKHFESRQISVVQVFLSKIDGEDARLLKRHDYEHSIELIYLLYLLQDMSITNGDSELEYETYRLDQRNRMLRVLDRTYTDTLDVPALDGIRELDDVLNGYQNTGEFSPARWFFVRHQGEDVGCLLLTDHPAQNQWELIYMGLIPAARQRGWGVHVTRQAQAQARRSGREQLVLVVDSTNDPAIATYSKAGFVEWFRRSVFLKLLGTRD